MVSAGRLSNVTHPRPSVAGPRAPVKRSRWCSAVADGQTIALAIVIAPSAAGVPFTRSSTVVPGRRAPERVGWQDAQASPAVAPVPCAHGLRSKDAQLHGGGGVLRVLVVLVVLAVLVVLVVLAVLVRRARSGLDAEVV